jgi:hypothetical protein
MIRHIAVFRFKSGTTDDEISSLDRGLATLPGLIPEIRAYKFGRDLRVTEGTWDYTVAADFDNEDGLKIYAGHPDHVLVVETIVKPLVDETVRIQISL